jgi:hypothetical protein
LLPRWQAQLLLHATGRGSAAGKRQFSAPRNTAIRRPAPRAFTPDRRI